MIAIRLAIAAAALILLPAALASTCPVHLVTIEPDGQASEGSRDALRDAFRAGLPLRVGWSLSFDDDPEPEVTHWSDGGFLTEFEGEIFAQLADIQAQGPRTGTRSILMPAKRKRWSGLIGTNGVLESNFDDGEVAPATRVRSEWCVDSRAACTLPAWRLVPRSALHDAVRRGYPLRVAWSAAGVEHSAVEASVAIKDDIELIVQSPKIPRDARIAWFAYAPEALCAGTPLKVALRDERAAEARRMAPAAAATTDGNSAGSYGLVSTPTARSE